MSGFVVMDLFYLIGLWVILISVIGISRIIWQCISSRDASTYELPEATTLGLCLETIKKLPKGVVWYLSLVIDLWMIVGLFLPERKLFLFFIIVKIIPAIKLYHEKSNVHWSPWFMGINFFFRIIIVFSILYSHFLPAL